MTGRSRHSWQHCFIKCPTCHTDVEHYLCTRCGARSLEHTDAECHRWHYPAEPSRRDDLDLTT